MRIEVPEVIEPCRELGAVHLVGIGGAGLSAIARVMAERGVAVSGSDGLDSPTLASLAAAGVRVHVGHAAEQLGAASTVVVSTAVREDNPEVVEAYARGLRVWPRSAGVASVLAGRRALAVAGTHGKTTTTSLLTVALQAAGADPGYMIGGDLSATGTNASDGSGDLFVVEADESDGAFLVYRPFAAVVTNVEADHLDQWGTEEAYAAAFTEFLDRIDPAGFLVTWADSEATRALADRARQRGLRVVTYGTAADADLHLDDLRRELQVPGSHYRLNALAALAVGLELGLDGEALRDGLASWTGTKRRMEHKGSVAGIAVYDSYAHHPSEIVGDLEAARTAAGGGRVLVAFQPHLVSRTRIFGAEMGRALGAADEVVVLDVYLAREDPDPDVTGDLVARAVPLPDERVHRSDLDSAAGVLAGLARPGDLVLTLGAGTVTTVAPVVLDLLAEQHGDG